MGKRILILAAIFFTFLVGCSKPKDPCDLLDESVLKGVRSEQKYSACVDYIKTVEILPYFAEKKFKSKQMLQLSDNMISFGEFAKKELDGKLWRMKCKPKEDRFFTIDDAVLRFDYILALKSWHKSPNGYIPVTLLVFDFTSVGDKKAVLKSIGIIRDTGNGFAEIRAFDKQEYINKAEVDQSSLFRPDVFNGDRYSLMFWVNDYTKEQFNIDEFGLSVDGKLNDRFSLEYLKDLELSCEPEEPRVSLPL